MPENPDVTAARAELERAVQKWLRVKALEDSEEYDEETQEALKTDDPVMLGWIVVAAYTSHRLELMDATACSYDSAEGQPAYQSRGLGMAAVDRWSQS